MSPHEYGLTRAAYDLPGLTAVTPIGRSKLYEEMQRGALRATKCGKRTLFLAPDVAAYLDQLRTQALTVGAL